MTVSRWAFALCLTVLLASASGIRGQDGKGGTDGGPVCSGHGVLVRGFCVCNVGYAGSQCEFCAPNYYNYPNCTFCLASSTCNGHGTCNILGGCDCAVGFTGPGCSQCATNYYNYPNCTFCLASTTCSGHGTCSPTGGCNCAPGWSGVNCSVHACLADVAPAPNGDLTVNVNDLLAVISAWGACAPPCLPDISPAGGDGTVNVNDLLAVISGWGPCL